MDSEHPILGFFHRWVEEFAKHCEQVHVICLQAGKQRLPANVTVHSLGKEEGKGRLVYLWRFYKLIWSLRREYDNVFVHMNQEYLLLAGFIWKVTDKKIFMWRNHKFGDFLTRVAAFFCDRVYYTSGSSFTASLKKSKQMPIGIDSDIFTPQPVQRKKNSLLYVGRIAPIKRVDILVEVMKDIRKTKPDISLTIVGGTANRHELAYKQRLEKEADEHSLPIVFIGPVTWSKLPEVYSEHELCINLTPPGAFDKVIGEALACECDILTANTDLREVLKQRVLEMISPESLIKYLENYEYKNNEVVLIRKTIIEKHSLKSLVREVASF